MSETSKAGAPREPCRLPFYRELPGMDLYMDQVITLAASCLSGLVPDERGLTPSMINNYVKMRVLPPPVKKRYGREHLAYLFMVSVLKQVLPVLTVGGLIRDGLTVMPLESLYDRFVSFARESFPRTEKQLEDSGPSLKNTGDGKWSFPILAALMFAVDANTERLYAERLLSSDPPEEKK